MYAHELFEQNKPRVVVTYPGRFQPFHQGHAGVFSQLQKKFGAENVYIATSNDQSSAKSPFNFSDKYQLMTAAGVPADKIIQTNAMYALPEGVDSANTIFITAVGAPDADRLNPDSVLKRDKKDKEGNVIKPAGSPGYYKIWNPKGDPLTADQHGYVIVIPEIKKSVNIKGQTYDVSHGTEARNLWNMVRDDETARAEFLSQLYGKSRLDLGSIFDKIPQTTSEDIVADNGDSASPISGGQVYEQGVSEDTSSFDYDKLSALPGKEKMALFKAQPELKNLYNTEFKRRIDAELNNYAWMTPQEKAQYEKLATLDAGKNIDTKSYAAEKYLKQLFQQKMDAKKAASMLKIHWAPLKQLESFLQGKVNNKIELSAYLVPNTESLGKVRWGSTNSVGIVLDGHITIGGRGDLGSDQFKMTNGQRGQQKYVSRPGQIDPTLSMDTSQHHEVLVDNWKIKEIVLPADIPSDVDSLVQKYNIPIRRLGDSQIVAENNSNSPQIVTRIDSQQIQDFGSNLKNYKHTDDWAQSGLDTGDDSYWNKKNLKTNTTKGLFAGDPRRTALYATGNAHETRYVEFTQNGQPIVYFDKKDLPAMRSRKTYLTVFDASNFKQLPTGEWFSENPGKPIKQTLISDPFQYIADQGWMVRVTDDLDKVFKQVKNMHKAGKIAQFGAEGMNENAQQSVVKGNLNEFAPGSGNDDGSEDPYKYPKPESYRRSAEFFGKFEAGHFDREDFDDATGVFKGFWGPTQIAYFKFADPAKTGSEDPGMGWYYEPESSTSNDTTSAKPAAFDNAEQRKQQELGMIDAFLKSGQTPKPGGQIHSMMKRHGLAEGADDVWGPQGNFAGDKPINLGGSVSKKLAVNDAVTYFGEKATILAMSKDRTVSRIHLKSGITQNVKTSDLKRVGQDVAEDQLNEACWKGYHKEGNKKMFGKTYPNCVKNKNESLETYIRKGECPGCGGAMISESELTEKQDACYHKVKSRYKVWPSAYASGALVQCRKKGAANWGNKSESITQEEYDQLDENLKKWFSDKWVRFGPDGKIRGSCARGDSSEGKPKCLPQSKAHALGKKGRASAAAKKRREDPNPERKGPAINVATKTNEGASGVIATKKQAKDPRYSMSLTKDVRPGQIEKSLRAFRLVEQADSNNQMFDLFAKFLPLAMKDLGLTTLPKIVPELHIESHDGQATFGRFVNDELAIHLALANRHPVDILRTLAHELVHFKQLTLGKINDASGITGSPEENQANTIAGIIMRHFNKEYPNAVNMQPIELDESLVTVNYGIGKNPGKLVKVGAGGRVPHAKLHVNVDKKTAKKLGVPHLNENGDDEADEVKKQKNLIPFPKGTVKVDVSDVYDWYKLGMEISDLDDADPADFGKGPPQTVMAFGDEEQEHKYLPQLQRLGLKTHDIDENFADGRNPGDKGSLKAKVKGKVTMAKARAILKNKNSTPRAKQLAHWFINMNKGRNK